MFDYKSILLLIKKNRVAVTVSCLTLFFLFVKLGFFGLSDQKIDLQLVTVEKRGFDIMVNTVGELDTKKSYRVNSRLRSNEGKIIFLAHDGANVKKGDVLLRFDPTPFEKEVLELKGDIDTFKSYLKTTQQVYKIEQNEAARAIDNAEYKLKSIKLDLEKIIKGDGPVTDSENEMSMEDAKIAYKEQDNFVKELIKLNDDGYSNATELALAQKKLQSLEKVYNIKTRKYRIYKEYMLPAMIKKKKEELNNARMELEKTKKKSAYSILKSQANVERAMLDLTTAETKYRKTLLELEKTTAKAPFDGIVILVENYFGGERRKPRIGDTAIKNTPILSLPDISSYLVYTKIREIDLHKANVGKKAVVHVDAFPELLLKGEITTLGALALKSHTLGQEKYFNLTITLKEVDPRLRPGMTVRTSILSKSIKDAIAIPVNALFIEGKSYFVYKFHRGDFEKTIVTIGEQNNNYVEITSGLEVGNEISLIEPDQKD